MMKFRRTLIMLLVMTMVAAFACPASIVYADEDLPAREPVEEAAVETAEEIVEIVSDQPAGQSAEEPAGQSAEEPAGQSVEEPTGQSVEEPAGQSEDALTIVYNVVETKGKTRGSLYGELPSVVGDEEEQVGCAEDVTIRDLEAHSYQTFTGNEKDRFAYVSYAFKGWMTEGGEIVKPGSEVAAETLDADGDGVAVLSSAWSGSWKSGSGTPFAKFSLWTDAMSANDCFEDGTLLGESLSSYTPSVGGSIMVGIDDEGNTITPDELASPSHGNKGKNIGNIYNNPELSFKENNQGKYMMVSYMGSSIIEADKQIRALAETGIHTDDSESGDVTWKLDSLPTDEEVLNRISSFVSRGMTTMRDENGKRIEADALTTENYAVLWCQVKYQSGSNDGWNINGVLSTKLKAIETVIEEIIRPETTEPETAEPETAEPETTEPETTEPETAEPETTEPETIEPETAEPVTPAAPAAPADPAAPAAPAAPAMPGGVPVNRQIVNLSAEQPVRPVAPVVEVIEESEIPMAAPTAIAENSGSSWAILNLLLLGLALYGFLPLLTLKKKLERVEALAAKGRFALAVEAMLAVVGLLAFLSTQDLSAPMIYADALTLPMAAISGAVCVIENKMRCAQHERAARA